MFAVVIVLLSITRTSSFSSPLSPQEEQCLKLATKPATDYVWPNKTVHFYLDKSLNQINGFEKLIREAIHEWENNTCIKFKDHTVKQRTKNFNLIKFVYKPGRQCDLSLQKPLTDCRPCEIGSDRNCVDCIRQVNKNCKKCTHEVGLNENCVDKWEVQKHIGWHLGINYMPDPYTRPIKLIQEVNTLYNCNNTCLFTPVCHNGGYVVPDAKFGCGKCVCQNGEDCQEVDHVDPNLRLLTDASKKGLIDGTQKGFDEALKKNNIKDTRINNVVGMALSTLSKTIDGDIEAIPQQIAVDQIESALGSALEKSLEGVKLAGPIAAGIAAAAMGILNGVIKGSVKDAVVGCISGGIGTFVGQAIGALIGTALAGPLGTVIGEILGGIIGGLITYAVQWVIEQIMNYIWPFLVQLAEIIWDFLKTAWREIEKFFEKVWEEIKYGFYSFGKFLIDTFG